MLAIHIYCSEEAIEAIFARGWGGIGLRQQQQSWASCGLSSFQRHQRFAEPLLRSFSFRAVGRLARIVPAQPHLRACFMDA